MPEQEEDQDFAREQGEELPGECSCIADPFASLPPELRPRPQPKKGGLREVKCPGCGKIYWTNRKTDYCINCEVAGGRSPSGG